jgi:AcrR family transcriptional regulator
MQGSGGGGSADPGERASGLRRATGRAILELSGEVGYERASVAAVVARGGSSLARFYATWSGKADCYSSAYEAEATALGERLVAGCSEAADWTTGMRLGLRVLEAYTAEDPALAAGLIEQVHIAGGPALDKHDELVATLARAVDRARAEITSDLPQPPPATAGFIVAAIEAAVIKSLAEGRSLRLSLPSLLYIAVGCYFGAAAARRAIKNWPEG